MATPTTFTPIAVDPVQLGTATGSAAGTLYTAGASGAVLDYISIVNAGTLSDQVTVYYEMSGGTAAGSVVLANLITVPADGMAVNVLTQVTSGRPFHMEASSKIRGYAETASQFTCHIGGVDYA